MSTSSNFNFDDWIIENELDEEISAILKKEKLITVKAILGLHDDDTKELFQGYPKGYLTSFRFAKSSLATKFANSENVNSKQFVETTETSSTQSNIPLRKNTKPSIPQKPLLKSLSENNSTIIQSNETAGTKPAVAPKPLPTITHKHDVIRKSSNVKDTVSLQNPSINVKEMALKLETDLQIRKKESKLDYQETNIGEEEKQSPIYDVAEGDDTGDSFSESDEEFEELHFEELEAEEKCDCIYSDAVPKRISRRSLQTLYKEQNYSKIDSVKRSKTFQYDKPAIKVETNAVVDKVWSMLPRVLESNVLLSMSESEIQCKQTIYEIISSQYNFVRSLTIAVKTFVNCSMLLGQETLGSCINMQQRKQLFLNLSDIRDINNELYEQLVINFAHDYLMSNIIDTVSDHLTKYKKSYTYYCCNQIYQDRMLSHLLKTNVEFQKIMAVLENNEHTDNLELRSFLLCPLQRITKYPTFFKTILKCSTNVLSDYKSAERALSVSSQLATECDKKIELMTHIEKLSEVYKTLIYNKESPQHLPLLKSDRYFIKSISATEIQSFKKNMQIRPICIFIFNNLFLITKPRKDGKRFTVLDYCSDVSLIEMISIESESQNEWPPGYSLNLTEHILFCILGENAEKKRKKYYLKFDNFVDKSFCLGVYK